MVGFPGPQREERIEMNKLNIPAEQQARLTHLITVYGDAKASLRAACLTNKKSSRVIAEDLIETVKSNLQNEFGIEL